MHCGLEVLQKNGLLKYKESFLGFKVLEKLNEQTEITQISLPVTFITYNKGDYFDIEFREQMKTLGFICAQTNHAKYNTIFIKQEDIDVFVSKIPELETMYIEKLPLFMANHLEKTNEIKISLIGRLEPENNYCRLDRLDIQKENQRIKETKERANIEFMKLVLNG